MSRKEVMQKAIFSVTLFCFLLSSCSAPIKETNTIPTEQEESIFTLVDSTQTGITFKNTITESTYHNGLMYHHYYNGGGVAASDFNNDGFDDLYFVSNLADNHLYLNKGNLQFENVTASCNCQGSEAVGTGVTVADINGDGWQDIFLSTSGNTEDPEKLRNQLLIHQGLNKEGIPVFEDQAKAYGLDFPVHSVHAAFFDYDKDGDLDMFLLNHGRRSYFDKDIDNLKARRDKGRGEMLLRNDSGKFADISLEANIVSDNLGYGLSIAASDFNQDGWIDLYISQDYSERDHFYINQKDGTFKETGLQSFGHVSNFSMGADIADINNDGRMDIMTLDMMAMTNFGRKTSMSGMNPERFWMHVDKGLHHQYMYNALQVNQGNYRNEEYPVFSDVAQMAGVHSTGWSWATLLFDMDNDGLNDIFVSNGIKRDYRNNDFKIYKEKKEQEALIRGRLDKDAFIRDMMAHMPEGKDFNQFFVNKGNLSFSKQAIDKFKNNSNGAAYSDLDNDGDYDLVTNNVDAFPFIYENTAQNNYLKIRLKEAETFHPFGTKLEVYIDGKAQVKELFTSRGFQSTVSEEIIFGLGNKQKVDSISISWPNAHVQKLVEIKANQLLTIEYNPELIQLENKTIAQNNNLLFTYESKDLGLNFKHEENNYDDFKVETLLPHRMSQHGPALATSDVNGDGLEDVFIGGAHKQKSALYLQQTSGTFIKANIPEIEKDSKQEDVDAVFFDIDQDNDLDLYVVSGGYEYLAGDVFYKDRLYLNDGNGRFNKFTGLPSLTQSGMVATPCDYDGDGDLDLFVGTRVRPGAYGRSVPSTILRNDTQEGNIALTDVTTNVAPQLLDYKMVTNAIWADMNGDNMTDLVVATEWSSIDIFLNKEGQLIKEEYNGLEANTGLWSGLLIADVNEDGFQDIVAGNLGLNYKYKASKETPFYFYLNDFDENKQDDIVLAYGENNKVYPVRGRQCSSQQMPNLKKKFKTYDAYGKADIIDIYGDKLEQSAKYSANTFASGIFYGNTNGKFEFKPFEREAQLSSINSINYLDIDGDGIKDLLMFGNLYGSEVETPRNDASYGIFLKGGERAGYFSYVNSNQSGLFVKGDVKHTRLVNVGGLPRLLLAKNDDLIEVIKFIRKSPI